MLTKQYGLVDPAEAERKKQKSQWSGRYNERTADSTHIDAPLEEGEEGDNYVPAREEDLERRRNEGLWTNDEEEYYNQGKLLVSLRPWLTVKTRLRIKRGGITLPTLRVLLQKMTATILTVTDGSAQ